MMKMRNFDYKNLFKDLRGNRVVMLCVWVFTGSFVGLILLGFGIHTLTGSIKETSESNMILQNEFTQERFKRLVQDLEFTEADREIIDEVLVPESELITFVRSLESITIQTGTGISITSLINDNTSGQPEVVRSYPLPVARYQVTISGPIESVGEYLGLVHRLPYLVHVENMTLSSPVVDDLVEHAEAVVTMVVAIRED